MPATHLVFDVNETLLDLSALDERFVSLFGDSRARGQWFASLLHWSMVSTLSGHYRDFTALARDCLDALADRHGVSLSDSQRDSVFDAIATLPPHPEVPEALGRLRDAGFSLTALTNSAQASVDAQFENAGLTTLFTHILSVDATRCFKPHPDVYALAARALDCDMADMRLIAAHDWDVTGAMRAGMQAAFVAREGERCNRAGEQPDIIGRDMIEVADRILAQDAAR